VGGNRAMSEATVRKLAAQRVAPRASRCDPTLVIMPWHLRPAGRRRSRGFTLVEIIAVVALIALAVTLISVSVGSGLSGARVKAASRDLVAALRYTRGQAIVKREEATLSIDVEQRRYRALERDWVELPKDMTMQLFTARSELEEEGVGRIRFFPDGSSTGGHIDLIKDEAVWRIEIQWLMGDVTVREGADQP
jgi:general secretion pathway protein H